MSRVCIGVVTELFIKLQIRIQNVNHPICSRIIALADSREMELRHKTAEQYVNLLLLPRFQEMDNALEQKAQELSDRSQAWKWFAGEYFQQQVLARAARGYNWSLVSADISLNRRHPNVTIYMIDV